MKKRAFIPILILFTLLLAGPAFSQVGLRGGVNLARFIESDAGGENRDIYNRSFTLMLGYTFSR